MVVFVVSNMTTHHFIFLCVVAQTNVPSHISHALLAPYECVVGMFYFCLTFFIP